MHSPTKGGYGRCFDEILYYTAHLLGDDYCVIMRFDVKSENFSTIKLPGDRWRSLFMIPYEGRLAIVPHDYPYDVVKLYILKDAHGLEWTRERFVLHVPCDNLRRDSIRFRGTTDAGEFIFAPYCFREACYIIYFDPRRNSPREVFFERDMSEFRRRCGFRSEMFTMEVFPSHIESLFSL
ncbi:hypothetical protein F2Q69_00008243 [Brassica cretica]|uniref:F-box associated beta-propeller type 3 domain-containing protein n=1 Tax=Brassica cretica TaxID=69181 RepID=A0A8S9PCV1_BRACR|nr:hypothetical protein F2Q69_00008243 [Brassica cretica]